MSIVQHPNKLFDDENSIAKQCLVVECDKCHTLAKHVGKDIIEAAENAIRFDNFRTIRGKKSSDPRTWLCGGCHKKNQY